MNDISPSSSRTKSRNPSLQSIFAAGSPDIVTKEKEKSYAGQNRHLRSFGRPDVCREPRRYFGWTLARWVLLFSNLMLLLYGLVFFIGSVVTYSRGYLRAIVIIVANRDILAVTLIGSALAIMTAIIGILGVRYKDRRYLAIQSLLLWLCFILITVVGYLAFKANTWNLKERLGVQWRHAMSASDQRAIEENLHCCGFENPSDHAIYFERCYPQSLLPGCQYKFYLFESDFLVKTYTITFAILPLHILIIIASLLCANHVEHQFGKRTRPVIEYLGPFRDWQEWEQQQQQMRQITQMTPVLARTTSRNDYDRLAPRVVSQQQ